MALFSNLFGGGSTANLQSIIDDGAFLVDVRTPGEFAERHVKGSVNIPLDILPTELATFKNKKNIVVFCRSGNRSGKAKAFLDANGISNVTNGGSWEDVNQFVK